MTPVRRISMLLGLACTTLGGCTQIENPRVMVPTEPGVNATKSMELHRAQFEDIPVPPGFEYVTRGNRSFSYADGGVRVGRFLYWGRASIDEVSEFYRRTLPLRAYGWELLDETPTSGGNELNWKKGSQNCNVALTRESNATYIGVTITGRE